jgi:uncharacterized membrane protein
MSDIKDQHEIDEMRRRLYARGPENDPVERHDLTDKTIDVARSWGTPAPRVPETPPIPKVEDTHTLTVPTDAEEPARKRGYRTFVLIGSLIIFIVGVGLSSVFLFLGGNKISSDYINLNLAGPATVGSGETLSFQVGITNQNSVAIESATLVVKYPSGSRTMTEPIKNMHEERISIDVLAAGEAKNVPLQIGIFGKENEQKQISATLEYRLSGSNGMFYKETEPLNFQITSSPLNLQVQAVRKIAAGQPIDITVVATSNANAPLKDVLITAAYPNGFTFNKSQPQPIYGQNVWKIDEIKPGETTSIKLQGTITGHTEETFGISFTAGQADPDNQFIVGSLLNDARTEFVIEHPFIDVNVTIAGDTDRSVVLQPGADSSVAVIIKNTLDESVYDMVVEVSPSGNALTEKSITTSSGFYDSNKKIVRWEVANEPTFSQVNPGDERRLDFSIQPSTGNTASFELNVNVYARRVAERSAQEQLIGTAKAEARYASMLSLGGQANAMTGPVPPKVGNTTAYLVSLVAEAGGNNVTNAVMTTSLPAYVEWLNDFSGPGALEYNPVSKQIQWKVGDIEANSRKELVFSVSILPSVSQVGITPVLVNTQQLRGTDRFTNTELKAQSGFISTELSSEAGYEFKNGVVTQ